MKRLVPVACAVLLVGASTAFASPPQTPDSVACSESLSAKSDGCEVSHAHASADVIVVGAAIRRVACGGSILVCERRIDCVCKPADAGYFELVAAGGADKPDVSFSDLALDGSRIQGRASVCAGRTDIFVDSQLLTSTTFGIHARDCETGERVMPLDVHMNTKVEFVRLTSRMCLERWFIWGFDQSAMTRVRCLEITVETRLKTKAGEDRERILKTIRVTR